MPWSCAFRSTIEALYGKRPNESVSKLRTFRDGLRILRLEQKDGSHGREMPQAAMRTL